MASTSRADRIQALSAQGFDLLVIGGGITGCGIARDAALRGLSVALVDKGDFANGTSSRSSRLIHGGVRYLEHGQLHLVFESSAERRRLLRLAPHLVRPLQFTWPVYAGARIPRWKLGAGLTVYDALSLFRNVGRHRRMSARDVLDHEPMLRAEGLLGGARYFDASTNDARLTLANAMSAAAAGAVVVNHCAVASLIIEGKRVAGANVRDVLGHRIANIRARTVVNATGPWSDRLEELDRDIVSLRAAGTPTVRGSKGAHIAVPRERIGNTYALTLIAPQDGRVVFVLPGDSNAIVGTTDTYTSASPDTVRASHDDVRYLIDAANDFFPRARLTTHDVVSAWAGIRPLVPSSGATPGGASREHAIATDERGLISITGGKLTTYRVMASDVLDVVLKQLGDRAGRGAGRNLTATTPLFGGRFASINEEIANAVATIRELSLATHLVASYGDRWREVWKAVSAPSGRFPVVAGLPYTVGEFKYCLANEMAETLGDLLIRRTHLAFETRDHGAAAAAYLAPLTGFDGRDVDEYLREVERIFSIDA